MLNKKAIKPLIVSLLAMGLTTLVVLFIVSLLTYAFKWQAPQAMIGITLTYILTGVFGGILHGCMRYGFLAKEFTEQPGLGQRIVDGGMLGLVYMLILFLIALLLADGRELEYSRWMSIGVFLVCSSILGHFMTGIFCKNR